MKQLINTPKAPAAIGPYSQAILANGTLYISGQLGANANGQIPEGIEAQTTQSLENLTAILEAAGMSMNNVVKTTVFLQDMSDFSTVNAIYAKFFADPFPARACIQVAGLPRGGLVEIECIAVK